MEYVICMDVSGDVCKEVATNKGLVFIPMNYSLGNDMLLCDGVLDESKIKSFYDSQRNGDLTQTSQITPFMYEGYFEEHLKNNKSIIYLCLSSGLSATYQAALLAKEVLKEKYPTLDIVVIDSLGATGGMGVLIERCLANKEKGLSIYDNEKDIRALVPKTRYWFMVQDLMYLKRGGRLSGATAVVGSMLNIKPILKIDENGKLVTIAKKRGNKQAVSYLLDCFKENFDDTYEGVVYINNADCLDLALLLKEEVSLLYPNLEIRVTSLNPIIGAHTGPGMLAICHIAK